MKPNKFQYHLCVSLIFFSLGQNGSCHSQTSGTPKESNHVATGVWGGENVRMEVTGAGAQLQFSCSRGTIDEALVLKDGRFSTQGTFTAEGPGPIREDNPPKKQPATYSGSVQDKSMTLTVKLNKTDEQVGNFTLEFGKPGRVRRCY
jgi:hypothetical protein